MKIQDIITNFKGKTFSGHEEVVEWLESSLTSLLDSIKTDIEKTKEEVKKQTGSYKYDDQYDDCINIINSHR